MRWRDALNPIGMQRVALLAPKESLRDLLVTIADLGWVDLEDPRASELGVPPSSAAAVLQRVGGASVVPQVARTPDLARWEAEKDQGSQYVRPWVLVTSSFVLCRTFMRYPGTLVVEFLDPLPPGLTRDEFIAQVSTVIEDATNRLVEAARQEQAQLFGRVPSSAAVKA